MVALKEKQQLVPGMRPGTPLMPNMFVPLVQQGHQGPRPSGRHVNTVPMQQGPQPVMQQQMHPRGRGFRYPLGRGMPDVSMQGWIDAQFDQRFTEINPSLWPNEFHHNICPDGEGCSEEQFGFSCYY